MTESTTYNICMYVHAHAHVPLPIPYRPCGSPCPSARGGPPSLPPAHSPRHRCSTAPAASGGGAPLPQTRPMATAPASPAAAAGMAAVAFVCCSCCRPPGYGPPLAAAAAAAAPRPPLLLILLLAAHLIWVDRQGAEENSNQSQWSTQTLPITSDPDPSAPRQVSKPARHKRTYLARRRTAGRQAAAAPFRRSCCRGLALASAARASDESKRLASACVSTPVCVFMY